jgi:hypothetical protein
MAFVTYKKGETYVPKTQTNRLQYCISQPTAVTLVFWLSNSS